MTMPDAAGPLRPALTAAGAGIVLTVAVLLLPWMRFAYRSPGGHLVLETTASLVAALVALLVYGRYRRSGALADLFLLCGMSLLSLTALFLVALPAVPGQDSGPVTSSWAALVVRVVAGGLILGAALVPPDRLHRTLRPSRAVALLVIGFLLVAVAALVLAARLPELVAVSALPEASGRPHLAGHPVVIAAQGVNLVCYAVAAVLFTRRAWLTGDDMLSWFGAACVLGAWARVHYLLFPSLYTEWLYTGDLLRLGFYALLLVGAVREILEFWSVQTAVAVGGERRRLARDLHDGVVQELGWIKSELARGGHPALSAATDRALVEARRALSALTEAPDEPLASRVRRAAGELGDRYDVAVVLALDESVSLPEVHHEHLVRILREAMINSARHAESRSITVTLVDGRLTVEDNGAGFDPAHGRPDGFGLTSMRERADAIGAALKISSIGGLGTCVEVVW